MLSILSDFFGDWCTFVLMTGSDDICYLSWSPFIYCFNLEGSTAFFDWILMMRSWLQDRPSTDFRHILQNSILGLSLLTHFQIVFFMRSLGLFAALCVCVCVCNHPGGRAAELQWALKTTWELLDSIKQLFASFPAGSNGSARGKFRSKEK